jgi:hypothetical protein
MATSRITPLAVFFLSLSHRTWAWGSSTDPLRVGYGVLTTMRATERINHDDDFDVQKTSSPRLGYESENKMRDGFVQMHPLLWDGYIFDGTQSFEVDFPCGDECEQCPIPDDFKNDSDDIDVMAFLGIRRAVPLLVHEEPDDWQ